MIQIDHTKKFYKSSKPSRWTHWHDSVVWVYTRMPTHIVAQRITYRQLIIAYFAAKLSTKIHRRSRAQILPPLRFHQCKKSHWNSALTHQSAQGHCDCHDRSFYTPANTKHKTTPRHSSAKSIATVISHTQWVEDKFYNVVRLSTFLRYRTNPSDWCISRLIEAVPWMWSSKYTCRQATDFGWGFMYLKNQLNSWLCLILHHW